VTLLHINDVYEITAASDGWGGPARLATLRHRLLAANPNVITVLAGDLLSPSALGTARVDGQRLDGRQMVEVLNAAGLDFATFGNHEFDLAEAAFAARFRESRFRWVSANVRASAAGAPLPVARHMILRFGAGRDTLRLALFGITMDRDGAPWATIAEPVSAGIAHARLLADSADVLVALTHLPLSQDAAIVLGAPRVNLVVGGHEHENLLLRRGDHLTPIAKADANLRTAWVHEITWDPRDRRATVQSRLVPLDSTVAEDSATLAVARGWVDRAFAAFRQAGFDPAAVVARSTVPLDGLESSVLVDTTTLTHAIAEAFRTEAGTEIAIFNAGSIRLDDVLPPGPITQYDVIRILPFGGPVVEVEMRGTLLRRVLDQGWRNRGTGGFLQYANIARTADGGWTVAASPLEDSRTYRLAVSDFLLTGREQGMDWLTREHAELRVLRDHRDVRFALNDELARRFRR
jgi:5'-nucleotidase